MVQEQQLKKHLSTLVSGKGAHADFDTAVKGISSDHYGAEVKGLPYTLWQIVEHMRLSQNDILDYMRNPDYKERSWPEGYWPKEGKPPKKDSWDQSVKSIKKDLREVKTIIENPKTDLFAQVPHGEKGHTILREVLLIADHNAYHVGQIIVIRRLLGDWKGL